MARIELINNGILFKEEEHEYWLGNKQLFGITQAIQKQVEDRNMIIVLNILLKEPENMVQEYISQSND